MPDAGKTCPEADGADCSLEDRDPGCCIRDHQELAAVEVSGAAGLRAEENARRDDEGRIGPPLPVISTEERDGAVYATVQVPGDHPAHEVLREGLVGDGWSIGEPSADNADYDKSGRETPAQEPRRALDRGHIIRKQLIPPPKPFTLPEALGGKHVDEDAPVRRPLTRRERRERDRRLGR